MYAKLAAVFALCAVAALMIPVVPVTAAPGAPVVAAEEIPATKQKRSVISVVSVRSQDMAVTSGDRGDNILFAKAEETITESAAYRLVGRDAWETRSKEILLSSEGFVDPATAKKFGKDIGVDKFLVVFIGGATQKRTVEEASDWSDVAEIFGKKNADKKSANKERAPYLECVTTIICRYTDVQTGERETKSYTGKCKDRTDKNAEGMIESSSINAAFEELRKDLWANRQPFVGKLVQVKDEYARIDLGKNDGIKKGIEFQFYATTIDGEFTDHTRLLNEKAMGRVIEVNDTNVKIEMGEMKEKKIMGIPTGKKEWKCNPAYLKDLQKAFASTTAAKPVIEAIEKQ